MKTAQELLTASQEALTQKQYGRAAEHLELLLQYAPAQPNLLFQLTQVSARVPDWGRVIVHASALLENASVLLPSQRVEIYALLSMAWDETGQATKTQYLYERIKPEIELIVNTTLDFSGHAQLYRDLLWLIIAAGDNALGERLLDREYQGASSVKGARISSLKALNSWCEESGIQYLELEPRRQITARNGSYHWQYHSGPFRSAIIPNGEVLFGSHLTRSDSGVVTADIGDLTGMQCTWCPHELSANHSKILHKWPAEVQDIDDTVLYISGPEQFRIGHWIIEFLPRMRAICQGAAPRVKLAIPSILSDKHRELLPLFGVQPTDLLECEVGVRYRFRNLVIAQPGHPLYPSVETTKFLANALRRDPPESLRRTRRIYLVRSMPTRQVTNFPEMAQVLDRHGFEYMDLSLTSVAEQRTRLSEADIVVSVYGSDLLAVLFMQPGTDFIELKYTTEILSAADLVSCTDAMFSMLNVNYHELVGETVHGAKVQKKDRDFTIDCPAFEQLLQAILARKNSGIDLQSPIDIQVVTPTMYVN